MELAKCFYKIFNLVQIRTMKYVFIIYEQLGTMCKIK